MEVTELMRDQIRQSIEAAKNLPIAKHRQQIIAKLEKSRVLIVSGDTGCGKTTQVPKFILEQGMHNGKEVHIICTQPRRLAAINIAKRVAQELGERVGQTVGYHVGMQRKKTPFVTKVTFMTTGIFLMRLVNNPRSLQKYTHLIMDEVHERDLDIDFSLVVVKHLLYRQEQDGLKFKLILMSATFNVELFSNYFSKKAVELVETVQTYEGVEERYALEAKQHAEKVHSDWGPAKPEAWMKPIKKEEKVKLETKVAANGDSDDEWVTTQKPAFNVMPVKKAEDPCEVVEINARMYHVRDFYLDKIIDNLKTSRDIELTSQDKELLHEANEMSGQQKPQVREGAMRAASLIVCDIIERLNTFKDEPNEKKSVLMFLPGLAEIFQFIDYMQEFYDRDWLKKNLELIPLHSSLNEEE